MAGRVCGDWAGEGPGRPTRQRATGGLGVRSSARLRPDSWGCGGGAGWSVGARAHLGLARHMQHAAAHTDVI